MYKLVCKYQLVRYRYYDEDIMEGSTLHGDIKEEYYNIVASLCDSHLNMEIRDYGFDLYVKPRDADRIPEKYEILCSVGRCDKNKEIPEMVYDELYKTLVEIDSALSESPILSYKKLLSKYAPAPWAEIQEFYDYYSNTFDMIDAIQNCQLIDCDVNPALKNNLIYS